MSFIAPRSQPSPDLRCAFCHGPALDAAPCAGCGALLHADCRAQTDGCSTLGCAQRTAHGHAPATQAAGQKARPGVPTAGVEVRTWLCVVTIAAAAALWSLEQTHVWERPARAVAYTYYNPRIGWSPKDLSFGFQFDRGPAETDPWGGRWRTRDPASISIADVYSAGPNRVDEHGAGDDILWPLFDGRELRATYLLIRARYLLTALACMAFVALAWRRAAASAASG